MTNIRVEELWDMDIPNMGRLCYFLMDRRSLTQAAIGNQTGLNRQKVNRMVRKNNFTIDTANEVVRAIAEEGRPSLSTSQQRRLMQMIPYSRGKALKDLEYELSATRLEFIRDGDRSNALQLLVDQLAMETGPAFIMDDLWFVHAYNSASLNLFGVDYNGRDRDKLHWWQSWHVIATKFTSGSIIRDAHIDPYQYFRPAVEQFCNDVRDYMFTVQVRMLIHRIYELSRPHNFGFENMWFPVATFESDKFPLDGFRRTLIHPSQPDVRLEARTIPAFYRDIEVVPDTRYTTRYKLVVWNGVNRETEQFFNEIGGRHQDILFAADYDTDEDNRFHVNDWPKVREHIDMIENAP